MSHYPLTYKKLSKAKVNSILDIGIGLGNPIKILSKLGLNARIIGIDISHNYLKLLNQENEQIYDDLLLADASHLPFKPKTFDAITCFQVIEHVPKTIGFEIIKEFSKASKKIVIITTPVGFVEADVDASNPFQKHKSGWFPIDFKKLGFTVRGYGLPRIKSYHGISPFISLLNVFLLPIFYLFPNLAYHMHCSKQIQ